LFLGFFNEVQVVIHVSLNPISCADRPAALAISGIPFNGPIGAARVISMVSVLTRLLKRRTKTQHTGQLSLSRYISGNTHLLRY
jgi:polyribonucleotide nucleotidyltransferase